MSSINVDVYLTSRRVFLGGLSLVYLCAFSSLYLQLPGLYLNVGIQPVRAIISPSIVTSNFNDMVLKFQEILTLLWFYEIFHIPHVEAAMDIIAIFGIILSLFSFLIQSFRISFVYLLLYLCYLSLFNVGQTFLSFQWDILLLETGVLAILFAPILSQNEDVCYTALFAIRFLLFKLLLMAGVVKLLSECRSWYQLTALNYHYATQCIPNQGGYWASQLPTIIHKISVASTLLIEIVVPFFILLPFQSFTLLAAVSTWLLMALIALTGNYNYFNLLTGVLAISLVDDSIIGVSSGKSSIKESRSMWGPLQFLINFIQNWKKSLFIFGCITIGIISYYVFELKITGDATDSEPWYDRMDIKLLFNHHHVSQFIQMSMLPTIIYTLGVMLTLAGLELSHLLYRRKWLLFIGRVVIVSAVAVVMLSSLCTMDSINHTAPSSQQVCEHSVVSSIYTKFQKYHITSSYGLFRRMTGMGNDIIRKNGKRIPSVSRPEIILECTADTRPSESAIWYPYEFLYKPGNITRSLPQIAPGQPRLDWQMWFAALGNYQHNPWIITLVDRVLRGVPEVLDLIGWEGVPRVFHDAHPEACRLILYDYKFTEYSSNDIWYRWNRRYYVKEIPFVTYNNRGVNDYLSGAKWDWESSMKYEAHVSNLSLDSIQQQMLEGLWMIRHYLVLLLTQLNVMIMICIYFTIWLLRFFYLSSVICPVSSSPSAHQKLE